MNEKYYPKNINDCYVNEDIKNKILKLVTNNTLQNTIFYGNSNTCKTTFVNMIVKEYYKNIKNMKDYCLYINLLCDKNIKNLNNIISIFCKTITNNYNSKYKKIIIIDDINYIHNKIQHQISTYLSLYPNIIFFIISNNIINVIDKIQSQCMILYLEKQPKEKYVKYINIICKKENIKINDNVINLLYILSNGDIRFSLIQIHALNLSFNEFNEKIFSTIYKLPNQLIIKNLIELCFKKDIDNIIILCIQLYKEDFSCNDILMSMFNTLLEYDIIEDKKIKILKIIGKKIYNNSKLIESILQLERCLIKICNKIEI
jgi:DNA polymerase III delta prime subunit